MNFPSDLLYTREHEWVRIDGEIATVGITDYAQSELGDIVFVELPAVNFETAQMQSFGTIEAVKTVSDLFAPLSGRVVETNSTLNDHPELINQDCYGEGWLIKLKISDKNEINNLLPAEEYQKLIP
ncbi:MAG: glycine cleavage system protein GcvH [candidate division KSB1 bacterium]|nr:glycine cleavage system protein GcvH [candidate division KSB1 bacterium]MDZ7301200.1 glycine cleavage system protein GcvH [candidate division KSB1 bacterium]MDZ7310576.1 glycine cleavage system protein GcvH [candidate division KSB1 bacterium]